MICHKCSLEIPYRYDLSQVYSLHNLTFSNRQIVSQSVIFWKKESRQCYQLLSHARRNALLNVLYSFFEILLYSTGVFYRKYIYIYILQATLYVVCSNQLQIVLRSSGRGGGGGGDLKVPYNYCSQHGYQNALNPKASFWCGALGRRYRRQRII